MAAKSKVVTVTTSATALNQTVTVGASDTVAGSAFTAFNNGAVRVYVGGSTVTTSGATTGLPLDPGDSLNVETSDDVVYGIVATGTCDVIVFEIGA